MNNINKNTESLANRAIITEEKSNVLIDKINIVEQNQGIINIHEVQSVKSIEET